MRRSRFKRSVFCPVIFASLIFPAASLAQDPSINDVCTQIFPSGWLWKPASQDSGGLREGKPLILVEKNLPGSKKSLKVYDANGLSICSLKRFSSERYYLGTGCRKTAKQLKAIAKESAGGNSTVYVEGPGTKCYGPVPDPTKRRDKR